VIKFHQSKIYFMKKALLFVTCCVIMIAVHAQNRVKEYSVSGGLLGAANFTKFKAGGTNASNIDYNTKTGWSGGLWVNFPLSSRFSFEPQVMFSSYSYQTDDTEPVLVRDGEISYISLPLQFKLHAGEKFAITAGPQFDFVTSIEDDINTGVEKEHLKQTSTSLVAGFELFPHNRLSFFGRYMHGFTNMNAINIHGTGTEFRNRNIQAGLKLRLFGHEKTVYQAAPTPLPAPIDTDGDGITDDVDKCPNEKGTAKYNGCPIPDSDGDGINDELDKCPNEKGTAKYDGCPIPDSDGDGINDELDKCPTQAGPANRNGCPITDRDNDGISDEEDKCPDVAGTAKNNGCPDVPPEVTKILSDSAQNISLATSSAKLSTTANTSLNQVVKVLNENPTLKVKIEGHTDNVEKNAETLSESRANAVKTYLTSKGISADRIEVEGFGSTMPIADNNTTAGKTKNRRVEIKVSY
jgi:outer membrane protein OmpA-like peptidoglycan-associated protein